MDVLMRDLPEQVVPEQRMVDQAALEAWLPGAMARVHKAAGEVAATTADQPHLQRGHAPAEPVFICQGQEELSAVGPDRRRLPGDREVDRDE
jgi:hypothetical protein